MLSDWYSTVKRNDRYEIEHIFGLNLAALAFERKYDDLIHPKPEARFKDILENAICFNHFEWKFGEGQKYKDYSGVYALTLNNKTFYIGETVNTFGTRIDQHKEALVRNQHYNKRLQQAYNKYAKGKISYPKIYLLEYGVCTEENKGCFKLMNLMREYYYQALALQSRCGLNNIQDTLGRLYATKMFRFNYKMSDYRILLDVYQTLIKYIKPPKSYKDINKFASEFNVRLYNAKGVNLYRMILECLREGPVKALKSDDSIQKDEDTSEEENNRNIEEEFNSLPPEEVSKPEPERPKIVRRKDIKLPQNKELRERLEKSLSNYPIEE